MTALSGVLPFFHSFGFTMTLWLPVIQGCGRVCTMPIQPMRRSSGSWWEKYKGTFLLATPTLLGHLYEEVHQGAVHVAEVCAGRRGKKVRESVAHAFSGSIWSGDSRRLRMYGNGSCGCGEPAELGRGPGKRRSARKTGTVGHPIPGVSARIVDPETGGARREVNQEGLLLVRGGESDAGVFRAAGEDGGSLHGRAGIRPATWR